MMLISRRKCQALRYNATRFATVARAVALSNILCIYFHLFYPSISLFRTFHPLVYSYLSRCVCVRVCLVDFA